MPFGKNPNQKKQLQRKRLLFRRDSEFNLIPAEVPLLNFPKRSIIMSPMNKGEVNFFQTMVDFRRPEEEVMEFLLGFLVEPELSASEMRFAKSGIQQDIIHTLLFECGFTFDKRKQKRRAFGKQKSIKRIEFERFREDLSSAQEMYNCLKIGMSLKDYILMSAGEIELIFEAAKAEAAAINRMSGKGGKKGLAGKKR